MAVYTYRDSRGLLSNVRPKVDLILSLFADIPNVWTAGSVPDHNNLMCCDYMVFNNRALGDKIVAYHEAHKDELDVYLMIWYGRIWRSYNKRLTNGRIVSRYTWDNYYGTSAHKDHPHIQYNNTPMKSIASSKPRGLYELNQYPYAKMLDFGNVWALSMWSKPYLGKEFDAHDVECTRKQIFHSMGLQGVKLTNSRTWEEFCTYQGFRKTWATWQRHLGYTGADADGIPGKISTRKFAARIGVGYREWVNAR